MDGLVQVEPRSVRTAVSVPRTHLGLDFLFSFSTDVLERESETERRRGQPPPPPRLGTTRQGAEARLSPSV